MHSVQFISADAGRLRLISDYSDMTYEMMMKHLFLFYLSQSIFRCSFIFNVHDCQQKSDSMEHQLIKIKH